MAKYKFQGDPAAIQAAAQMHSSNAAARAQAQSAAYAAQGQIKSTAYGQPGQFANALAQAAAAQAGAFGNLATAAANERSNMYGANAMAEAARQGAIGNIGSAGLGAYGSSTNAAMDAWARNQQAYNQSLASMQGANQNTLGTLGASRNQALGGLAGAYGLMGMGGMLGGGQFTAGGVGGPIADGSYSGGGWGGGSTAGLDGLQANLMNNDILQAAVGGNTDAMNRLDGQHMSSRDMPNQMLGQSLAGLMTLTDMNTRNVRTGLDQFYGNQQRAGDQFQGVLAGLSNKAGSAAGNTGKQIQDMWDKSLGNTDMFMSPAQRKAQAQQARIAALENKVAQRRFKSRDWRELQALKGLA